MSRLRRALSGAPWGRLRLKARSSTQLTGLLLLVLLVLSYLSADRLNDQAGGSKATTWVNTAFNAGTAAGYGLTGLAVDRIGTAPPMLAGAVVLRYGRPRPGLPGRLRRGSVT